MYDLFSVEPTKAALQIFGPKHMTVVFIFVLLWASFFYFRTRWEEKEIKTVRTTLAILLALNEIGLHIWSAYWGIWTIQTMLPFHMCSIMLWIIVYMALTDNRSLYDFAYFLGIGGALQAFLTPADASSYDISHYRIMQTLIAHGLIITIPLFMTVVEGMRPTWASFKRIFIWTNIYMILIFFPQPHYWQQLSVHCPETSISHPHGCALAMAVVHPAIGAGGVCDLFYLVHSIFDKR